MIGRTGESDQGHHDIRSTLLGSLHGLEPGRQGRGLGAGGGDAALQISAPKLGVCQTLYQALCRHPELLLERRHRFPKGGRCRIQSLFESFLEGIAPVGPVPQCFRDACFPGNDPRLGGRVLRLQALVDQIVGAPSGRSENHDEQNPPEKEEPDPAASGRGRDGGCGRGHEDRLPPSYSVRVLPWEDVRWGRCRIYSTGCGR